LTEVLGVAGSRSSSIYAKSPMHSSSVAGREIFVSHNSGRVTAHPSITGWKTAPRASGADDVASVLFFDSGGIMLSGVAEFSVFSMQMEIRPKRNVATRLLA
jgi:hypothetical protein